MKLIVKEPFGSFARGDEITGDKAISEALESNPGHVVRVSSDEPTDKPVSTPPPALPPSAD